MAKLAKSALLATAGASLLAACATTGRTPAEPTVGEPYEAIVAIPPAVAIPVAAPAGPAPPAPPRNSSTPSTYEIVRYIGVDGSTWKPGQVPQNYADLYTRVVLTSMRDDSHGVGNAPRSLRNYDAENRDWFSRLWSGKTDTVTTLANIKVRDPGLQISIPLFSITHASGAKLGNNWNTLFTASNVESPLFKIGPNTGLAIHLSAKISSDVKSRGASLAIGAITTAVKIAAPTSTLLTTLSKPEANNAATAIDTAVSSLLSHSISEDLEVGRLADSWTKDSQIRLYGCAPFVRAGSQSQLQPSPNCAEERDIGNDFNLPVGEWGLRLTCPRLSAFDPRDICNALSDGGPPAAMTTDNIVDLSTPAKRKAAQQIIANGVSDGTVLEFNLSSQVTVQTFVQSQTWFTAFTGPGQRTKPDFDRFCSGGMVGMEMAGFSKLDSALVLRAIINQMPQLAALLDDFRTANGAACTTTLNQAGVTLQ